MREKLAVDIGDRYIKVVEGYRKKGSFFIRKIGMVENPVGNFRTVIVEDEVQKSLSLFLREYLRKLDVKANEAYCSVSGQDAVVHYFEVPDLPEREIRNAVRLEMLQVIPGGFDNLEYDYTVLSSSGKKTVLFVGFPKEKSRAFESMLAAAGLRPLVMDADGLALGNCRQHLNRADELSFVVNVGAVHTNVCIAERDGFCFIRDIRFGGGTVASVVKEARQVSLAEAEAWMAGDEARTELAGIVERAAQVMLDEVLTGSRYFESKTGRKPLSFHMLGGGAALPGLRTILEENLGIPAEPWDPLSQIQDALIPADARQKGPLFGVALGLLTRDVS